MQASYLVVLSAASAAPGPSATMPRKTSPVAIHAGAVAALMHISESPAVAEASASQIPITDLMTALSGLAWRDPVSAALRGPATSAALF